MTRENASPENEFEQEWLTAYLDDELDNQQRQVLEVALKRDVKLAESLKELASTQSLLRSYAEAIGMGETATVGATVSSAASAHAGKTFRDTGSLAADKGWLNELDDGLEPVSVLLAPRIAAPSNLRQWTVLAASVTGVLTIGAALLLWNRQGTNLSLSRSETGNATRESGQATSETVAALNATATAAGETVEPFGDSFQAASDAVQLDSTATSEGVAMRPSAAPGMSSAADKAEATIGEIPSARSVERASGVVQAIPAPSDAPISPLWHYSPEWSQTEITNLRNSHALLRALDAPSAADSFASPAAEPPRNQLRELQPDELEFPVAIVRIPPDQSLAASRILQGWRLTPAWTEPEESLRVLFISSRQLLDFVSAMGGRGEAEVEWVDPSEAALVSARAILVVHFLAR